MKDCRRLRKAIFRTPPLPAELEQHLFACQACRRFIRAEQILGLMNEFRQSPASFSHEFVERVMSGLAGREEQQAKGWFGLEVMRWAALLMFSIAAGYGFSVSEGAATSIEWAASLMVVSSPITSMETLGFNSIRCRHEAVSDPVIYGGFSNLIYESGSDFRFVTTNRGRRHLYSPIHAFWRRSRRGLMAAVCAHLQDSNPTIPDCRSLRVR